MNQPWVTTGGPDVETLVRLIEVDGHSDSEIAALYGVTRQTVAYWRMKKAGIARPGPGNGQRRRRRERLSHKDLIHWEVQVRDMNNPIRKRLVEVSLHRQGVQLAPDAAGRVEDFLAFLADEDVVVTYDPDHVDSYGTRAPFYFVPRTGRDAAGDIVRR